jgi:hypothetical protein
VIQLKRILLVCSTLLMLVVVTMGVSNSGFWSLDRSASHVRIDNTGQIRVEPRSGKGSTVGGTFAVTTADALTVGGVIVPQNLSITLCCLGASSASGDAVFIANRAYQVTAVRAVWSHVGGSSAAAMIEKLTGTTAPGSGTAILTSAFDLTTTANTVRTGTLSGTVGNLQLAAGDRLGVKLSGTLTALTGLNVTIHLKPI